VLGQRLIKQTVLFDGRYAHYHLYYANANAEVGSVLTTFPYKRVPGRQGSGQISSTAYTVPKGAIGFWTLGLTLYLGIALVALVQPRWRAVGIVWLVFVLATAVAALVARGRARQLETPAAILRRRGAETRRWWNEQIAADPDGEEEEP